MGRQAERNIIGCLLIDQDALGYVYGALKPGMFTDALMGAAYTEFLRGYDNCYMVNAPLLVQRIGGDTFPEGIVVEELAECMRGVSLSIEIKPNAAVVVDEYKARTLDAILQGVRPAPAGIDQQIGQLMAELEALQGARRSPSRTLPEIVRENKGRYFVDDVGGKVYLGFPRLDELTGGLEGGDVVVIGARPAVGKSAFVTQVALNLAQQGKRVGFFNLEMQEKQVYERFVAARSGIGLTRLRRATQFLGDEKERFDQANDGLERQDDLVITTGSRSAGEIRGACRHMGYDVVIIDYLQLVRPDKEYRGNRYAEVGSVSRAVKALAMELDIPVIALSQLNRVPESREGREPTMAELRESGDIEQDASVIVLMWNLSPDDRSKKGCKVEKQRQGATGKVPLDFDGDHMRFTEADEWMAAVDDCPFK